MEALGEDVPARIGWIIAIAASLAALPAWAASLSASPTSGPPGTSVAVGGGGFTPGQSCTVHFTTGSAPIDATTQVGGCTVGSEGELTGSLIIPSALPGGHTIWACNAPGGAPCTASSSETVGVAFVVTGVSTTTATTTTTTTITPPPVTSTTTPPPPTTTTSPSPPTTTTTRPAPTPTATTTPPPSPETSPTATVTVPSSLGLPAAASVPPTATIGTLPEPGGGGETAPTTSTTAGGTGFVSRFFSPRPDPRDDAAAATGTRAASDATTVLVATGTVVVGALAGRAVLQARRAGRRQRIRHLG